MAFPRIVLSDETSLVYVLRESGCHGHLTRGEIERTGVSTIRIYGTTGQPFEYLSDGLRTWCLLDACGIPIEGWNSIEAVDVARVTSYSRDPKQ